MRAHPQLFAAHLNRAARQRRAQHVRGSVICGSDPRLAAQAQTHEGGPRASGAARLAARRTTVRGR
eukprot:12799311-Alexandrium_andersonii.AAC.1